MSDPRMSARGLVREFGPGIGVAGIDLEVSPGEIHALVGLNGAGKTTLMRLLLGMLRPTSGIAMIDGHDVASAPAAVWSRVGHLVDHALAYGDLTTRANITVAARLHGMRRQQIDEAVAGIMNELDLDQYSRRRARTLSQGNLQRLGLATALVHGPLALVLDEPTNGLDPAGVILLRESLLRRCAAGAGVLVSSHHLDEVARVATRITVVNRGRVVGALDPHGIDIERAFFALIHADDEEYTP